MELKYSNNKPVKASDFGYSIQRAIKLPWGGKSFYTGNIVGALAFDKGQSKKISGIVAKTRLDSRLTSGIWSSPTSNNLSTMYFGTASSSCGQSRFRPNSVRPARRFTQDPADPG